MWPAKPGATSRATRWFYKEENMGYDLHITRKEFWADDGGPEIPLEEWVALVKADPSIQPDDKNPGPNNYVFQYGQNACPLWWEDDLGEIHTKNPRPHSLQN